MTFTPGLLSGRASGLFSGRVGRLAGTTVFDSDFLLITVAFNCADDGLTGALSDSTGAAGAFASIREPGLTGALAVTLFEDFAVTAAGIGFVLPGFSVVLAVPAFFVLLGAGAFAATGRVPAAAVVFFTVEGIGVFAGFFIAFAMESTIN